MPTYKDLKKNKPGPIYRYHLRVPLDQDLTHFDIQDGTIVSAGVIGCFDWIYKGWLSYDYWSGRELKPGMKLQISKTPDDNLTTIQWPISKVELRVTAPPLPKTAQYAFALAMAKCENMSEKKDLSEKASWRAGDVAKLVGSTSPGSIAGTLNQLVTRGVLDKFRISKSSPWHWHFTAGGLDWVFGEMKVPA